MERKFRVMIINPPHVVHRQRPKRACFPFSLGYLGAYLRKYGYEVSLLDAVVEGFNTDVPAGGNLIAYGLRLEEIRERIAAERPDVVGLSCIFHNTYWTTLAVAKVAKEQLGVPYVVVGGTHIAGLPDPVLRNPFVDFMILGEGEYSFRDLLDVLAHGSSAYTDISGLAFRDNDDIVVNPKLNFSTSLDTIPWPARDLLPMEKYIRINSPHGAVTSGERTAEIFTSRGCDRKCTFCASTRALGQLMRDSQGNVTSSRTLTFVGRPVDDVIAELRHLKETYDIRVIQFEDDNLIADKKRVIALMRAMVEQRLDFKWTLPNGLDFSHLDEEIIRWMKRSGCVSIIATIESGDQHTLRHIMKKPINLEKVPPLVRECEREGIDLIGAFIVGMPGETYESVRRTFDFAAKHFLEANIHIFLPLPGTPAFDECREKGYIGMDYLDRMEHDFRIPKVNTPLWTAQELDRFVRRQYLLYFAKAVCRHPVKFIRRYLKAYAAAPSRFLRFFKFWLIRGSTGKVQRPAWGAECEAATIAYSAGDKYLRSEFLIKKGMRIPLDGAGTKRLPAAAVD